MGEIENKTDVNITVSYKDDITIDVVVISRETYNKLIIDSEQLEALLNYGVDNWSGYDLAMKELYDNNE